MVLNLNGPRYYRATTTADGLMSAADKVLLDARTAAPTTDANGWTVQYLPSGKRLWTRRWLGVTLTGAADLIVVNAASLPVGAATQAAVHVAGMSGRTNGNSSRIVTTIDGQESSSTLTIASSTTDGTSLSSKAATIDVSVTLIER